MYSKEAIRLAKPFNEALEKIAERQERECPNCAGFTIKMVADHWGLRTKRRPCPTCNGTGKIKGKWEWEPKLGEWYSIQLENQLPTLKLVTEDNLDSVKQSKTWKRLIPILHWEEDIEPILKGMGCSLEFTDKGIIENYGAVISDRKNRTKAIFLGEGKTRQLAVMRAVIELGKGV